jgi:predicted metalloendopeptidase/nitrogen fixation-related uncharacterized protein
MLQIVEDNTNTKTTYQQPQQQQKESQPQKSHLKQQVSINTNASNSLKRLNINTTRNSPTIFNKTTNNFVEQKSNSITKNDNDIKVLPKNIANNIFQSTFNVEAQTIHTSSPTLPKTHNNFNQIFYKHHTNQTYRKARRFCCWSSKSLYLLLGIAILISILGIIAFFIWLSKDPDHHKHHDEKIEDQKYHQENNKPDQDIGGYKHYRHGVMVESDEQYHKREREKKTRIRREEETEEEESTKDACAVGWRPLNNQCVRNLYWPDPVDQAMQDQKTHPCDNFYQYACGSFVEDSRNLGVDATFKHLYKNNRNLLHDIIVKLVKEKSSEQSKISSFYHSCLEHKDNQVILTGKDSQTFQKLIKEIDNGLKSYKDLSRIFGILQLYDTVLPIQLSFELNPVEGKTLIPLIQQGGLFESDKSKISSKEHLSIVQSRMSGLSQSSLETLKMAKKVVKIEQSLSSIRYETKARNLIEYTTSPQFSHDIVDNWHQTVDQVMLDQGFNLTNFLIHAKPNDISDTRWLWSIQHRPIWMYSKSYFMRLGKVITSHSIDAWKCYLKHALLFDLVDDGAPRIDPEAHYAYHRAYDSRYALPWKRPKKFLSTVHDPTNKEGECIFITEAYLPVLLDNYFINAELDEDTRESARSIVESVKHKFVEQVSHSMNYLTPHERNIAKDKIESIHFQIGAPDDWPLDRSDLEIVSSSFTENILLIRKYHLEGLFRLFSTHVERNTPLKVDELFDGLVSVVNAFYQHQLNTVTINAGILQPPVFSRLYDRVAQTARLGVFVGHELTHSIDTIGILFDKEGSINPWLSDESRIEMKKRYRCYENLYSRKTLLGNTHDGSRTVNENVADKTGFEIAYNSLFDESVPERYQSSTQKQLVDQKREFYLAYAQVFCESINRQQEQQMIRRRTHSVSSMRVNNVVMQHEDFKEVWQCPEVPSVVASIISSAKKCSIMK